MNFIDLPIELVQAIMEETLWLVGLRQAVHLRLVSKLFDTEVQRAIYSLPSFDTLDRGESFLPQTLYIPKKMSPAMTTRLILSKMRTGNSEKRPLCIAITRAVDHLDNQFGQKEAGSRLESIEALAGAAARALRLDDISDCLLITPTVELGRLQLGRERRSHTWSRLHPGVEQRKLPIDHLTPSSDSYIDSVPQDALIAAICTKRFQLAKQLIEEGVKATTKSPAFGVPFDVAATMGAQEVVRMILETLLERGNVDDVDTRHIIKKAKRSALRAAAAEGHEHIVQMILNDMEHNGEGLSASIRSAVKNGHEDIASLLLRHRTPFTLRELGGPNGKELESGFWKELCKQAAQSGCENIRRTALESVERMRIRLETYRSLEYLDGAGILGTFSALGGTVV